MKINIKAALLSAFVLPGLGQLHKGEKVKGCIIIALVNIFLLAAVFLIMQGLGPIMLSAKLTGSLDTAKALEHIQKSSPGAKWLLTAFFWIWLYSLVDAAADKRKVNNSNHSQ